MKILAKEVHRLWALAELNPELYKHEYEALRRILATAIREAIYGR